MAELEHISTILSRALRNLQRSWGEQEEMRDLGRREIDASQEGQESFDDI